MLELATDLQPRPLIAIALRRIPLFRRRPAGGGCCPAGDFPIARLRIRMAMILPLLTGQMDKWIFRSCEPTVPDHGNPVSGGRLKVVITV